MTINFDDKGKYFTDIISKEAVKARIQTTNQYIEGEIHIRHECRLKDELDLDEPFLAITNACVFNPAREVLFRTQFIAVRRDQVVWITTARDIEAGDLPC
jgi:hypothetical protein